MKTERRHELQTNQLADALGKEIIAVRPYWKLIAGGLIAAVAIAIAWIAISQSQTAQQQAAWKPYFEAQSKAMVDRDDKPIENVAFKAAGTPVALFATQSLADRELAAGARLLYVNRKDADEHLTKSAQAYGQVFQNASSTQVELKVRALLGQASAYESLRDVEKAQESLVEAKKTAPNSVLGKEAERRLKLLEEHKEFYAWFKDQPPVSPHQIPGSEKSGTGSPFKVKEAPADPDIKFSVPPKESGSTPKTPEQPAGAEKPAAEKPESPAPKAPEKEGEKKAETPATPGPESKPAEPAQSEAKPAAETKPAPAAPETPKSPAAAEKTSEK